MTLHCGCFLLRLRTAMTMVRENALRGNLLIPLWEEWEVVSLVADLQDLCLVN
jgi:hypothetical protein